MTPIDAMAPVDDLERVHFVDLQEPPNPFLSRGRLTLQHIVDHYAGRACQVVVAP